ncbi:PTS sugar transporter subunit IIA [Anaerosporobacter sp.]
MELLKKENVRIMDKAKDWKDAIRISVQPLEEQGYVEARYKEEIIAKVEELGPYIILAPSIALPHARPDQGVIKSQVAITLFREDVSFDKEDTTAKLFITLAAADSNSHIDTLMAISNVLQNEENCEKLLQAEDVESLYHYFVEE